MCGRDVDWHHFNPYIPQQQLMCRRHNVTLDLWPNGDRAIRCIHRYYVGSHGWSFFRLEQDLAAQLYSASLNLKVANKLWLFLTLWAHCVSHSPAIRGRSRYAIVASLTRSIRSYHIRSTPSDIRCFLYIQVWTWLFANHFECVRDEAKAHLCQKMSSDTFRNGRGCFLRICLDVDHVEDECQEQCCLQLARRAASWHYLKTGSDHLKLKIVCGHVSRRKPLGVRANECEWLSTCCGRPAIRK